MKIGRQRIRLLFMKTPVAIVMMVVDVIRIHGATEMGDGMALLIHLKKQKKRHKRQAGQFKFIVHKIIRRLNAENNNVWWPSECNRIFI